MFLQGSSRRCRTGRRVTVAYTRGVSVSRRLVALLCLLALTLRVSGACEAMMVVAVDQECCDPAPECPSHAPASDRTPEPGTPTALPSCCIVASESGVPALPAPPMAGVSVDAPLVPVVVTPAFTRTRLAVPLRSSPIRVTARPAHVLFSVFLV